MTNLFIFITRLLFGIFVAICVLYLIGMVLFNCALAHDVKNELGGMLSLIEFKSLKQNGICSSSFDFIRNGEDWQAFGVADIIHGPDVYICKRVGGNCG